MNLDPFIAPRCGEPEHLKFMQTVPTTFRYPNPEITLVVMFRNDQTFTFVNDNGEVLGRVRFNKSGLDSHLFPALK